MRWPVWIDDQWDKIHSGLGWFEGRAELKSPNPSSTLDLFQLALASCLGYLDFRFAEVDWVSRYPRIAAWYLEISQRLSLVQTRPEIPAP
jgi:glutathione S-transferase